MADLGTIAVDVTEYPDSVLLLEVRTALEPRTKTVSGVIYDDTNTPCARIVRAYRRADGRLVDETTSDATTGVYALVCTAEEVSRLVLDDDAGVLYDDLVDRVIPGP